MGLGQRTIKGKYLSIIQGNLREKSTQDNPDAIRRDYETPSGEKGTKYELVYPNLTGKITGVEFKTGEYEEQIVITVEDDQTYIVQMISSSRYAIDFMQKLPNVNLKEEIKITPYDFEDEKGRRMTGVSLQQGEEKLKSYYWDGKKNVNGIPEMEKANPDKDDWKVFFIELKKFLKAETIKLFSELEPNTTSKPKMDVNAEFEEGDDLPF